MRDHDGFSGIRLQAVDILDVPCRHTYGMYICYVFAHPHGAIPMAGPRAPRAWSARPTRRLPARECSANSGVPPFFTLVPAPANLLHPLDVPYRNPCLLLPRSYTPFMPSSNEASARFDGSRFMLREDSRTWSREPGKHASSFSCCPYTESVGSKTAPLCFHGLHNI